MALLIQLLAIVLLMLSGVVFVFAWLRHRKRAAIERLQSKRLHVRLPRAGQEGTDVIREIARMEQLFGVVAGLKKPLIFEVAVPHVGEEIQFYVIAPARVSASVVRQIHALWSNAIVEETGDYNVFHHEGVTLGGWVKLKEHFVRPIQTYRTAEVDTFQPILGGLAKVDEVGEGGAVQIIVRPADRTRKRQVQSALKLVREGWRINDINKRTSLSDFFDAVRGSGQKPDPQSVSEEDIRAIEKKLSKPLLEVNVRIVASAPSQVQAESIFQGLTSGFAQFGSPDHNEFGVTTGRNIKKLVHVFAFREYVGAQEIILNSEELASIFHFPTPFTEVPKVAAVKAKQLEPPTGLPKEGTLIGESMYRGEKRKIFVTDEDRQRHMYVIGQTGTGKSNLLVNMIQSDITRNKGVCVIDPHGDLVEHVLGLIPEHRQRDVIYFDPSYLERPLGLNMLAYHHDRPEEKTFIVNELIGIFDKLYDLKATGGPMFEQYMRNALLLLMEDADHEPATLMEVPRVFTDAEYRKRKLARIANPTVVDFWHKEAEKAGGEAALANITPYITSKFSTFTANDYMRTIIGQETSSFDFRSVMDEGKILLVNLSKGKIGALNANLLGMIVVGKLLMAALSRVDIAESQRRDFNLFIDEFQNFTTDSITSILSEARKYRLHLTVAHQFIAQLPESIRDAVFGNVGSTLAFRVGSEDADVLVKQFEPRVSSEDLINIDNYHAYVRLLIRGETTPAFNIRTFAAAPPNEQMARELMQRSYQEYGRNRETIDQNIVTRLRS